MVEVRKSRGSRTLRQWFRESRQAELLVIFGEDLAALLGLVLALIAVLLAVITGNPLWDAIGTLVIGVLLIVVAVFIAVEVKAMLIGQSAEPAVAAEMRQYLEAQPEVERVMNLITMQLGNDVMIAVKAKMAEQTSATQLLASINAVEVAFRKRFPQARWSFFEPDQAD
jgi:divalent metal cation (Fe/Co/Zn/Cd) transporter